MNISGFGFHMNAGMIRHYDNLSQSLGRTNYTSQDPGLRADALPTASGAEVSLNVNKAMADMDRDSDLKEFQIFVRSGEVPQAQKYQEDWMRPVENFAL